MQYGINTKAVAILTVCLLALIFPPAVRAGDHLSQERAGYHSVPNQDAPELAKRSTGDTPKAGAHGRVVVRGEGSPLLYIGGTIGIHGEVFFGDIPAAPDEAGADGEAGAGGEGSSDT
ncbi:MAG: hypothetical protein AB1700_14930, partial [Bacillota bacterium]